MHPNLSIPAFRANSSTLRVSLLGGEETLREIGKLDADGKTLLSIRHHVDTDRWQVSLPFVPGGAYLPVVGSASSLRDAYRLAERQRRVQRHQPDRLLRQRERIIRALRAQRTAALERERALKDRLAEIEHQIAAAENHTTQAMIGALKCEGSLREQLDAANAKLTAEYERALKQGQQYRELQSEHIGLLARYATLQGQADELRAQLGLPTSDDLVVRGSRPVYPLRRSEPEPARSSEPMGAPK